MPEHLYGNPILNNVDKNLVLKRYELETLNFRQIKIDLCSRSRVWNIFNTFLRNLPQQRLKKNVRKIFKF